MALLHCTCFRTSENIHVVSCPENDKVLKRDIKYYVLHVQSDKLS